MLFACASGAKASETDVADLLMRYDRAMSDPGAGKLQRFEVAGTIVGGGSAGSFHLWHDGDNERLDQNLGLRRERKIRAGERFFFADESGYVREYHGVLLRHSRTEALIDSGELAAAPQDCRLLGSVKIAGRAAYELAVTAQGGDTEFLYLDAQTALPVRLSYDEDDGQTTINLSDWRTVNGHRFAFRTVASDGNHAYDLTQTTSSAIVDTTVDPVVFVVPRSREIEMRGVEHVPLIEHDGHFFVPVRIGGRTYRFLLDSGAQGILLDRHVVRALKLHEEGALEASGAQRTGGLRLARLVALAIGGATMRDQVVATLDLGESTHGAFRIDGILGYPFFASAIVRVDFARKTMAFGPAGSLASEGDSIDVDLDRGLSEAMLSADGVRAPFMIDTGNAADVLLYRPFVALHPGIVPSTLADMRSYGLGGSTDSYQSLLRELVLGTTTLHDVRVGVMLATQGAFADRFDAGNIGLGVLRNFIVTFDYPDDALYVEKSGNTSAMRR
jgi:hypothetical protein